MTSNELFAYKIAELKTTMEAHMKDEKVFQSSVQDAFTDVKIEIATLKARSAMWGFVAGLVPAVIALFIELFKLKS